MPNSNFFGRSVPAKYFSFNHCSYTKFLVENNPYEAFPSPLPIHYGQKKIDGTVIPISKSVDSKTVLFSMTL